VDAFGTDEVTLVTLLKGKWFLGILLTHKPFLLDRCPVSGSLVDIPAGCQWMVLRHFNSALQARKQVFSYLSMVHEVLKRFDLASWCFGNGAKKPHSLSDDEAKMGCITGTCQTRGAGLLLTQSGGSSLSLDLSRPPQDLSSSIKNPDPPG
jgi:hypothetical protein